MGKFDKKGNTLMFALSGTVLENIKEAILFSDKIILLIAPESIGERNVLCYSNLGHNVWTVSPPIRVHLNNKTHFVGITIQNGNLIAYSKDGFEYNVCLETGEFHSYEFVK